MKCPKIKGEVFVTTTGQSGSTIGTKSIFKPFYTNIEKNVFESRFLSNYELTAVEASDGPVIGQYVLSVGYLSVPSED